MACYYPEQHFLLDNFSATLFKRGDKSYTKASYPVRTGIYSEIETDDYTYHFNLNSEIIRIIGRTADWPHPHEWLKRTTGNDWVYYSTGGYTGVFETTGEYYLPNFPYVTNNVLGGKPFLNESIQSATRLWHQKLTAVREMLDPPDNRVSLFLDAALAKTPGHLAEKAEDITSCCGGRTTVLPPDTRHVDYNVIPLSLSEGCLHKCRFCKVKNSKPFSVKSSAQISEQITGLRKLYGEDLFNYNSVFLGEHDSLCAGPQPLCFAVREAVEGFHLNDSWCHGSNIFLFGSAFSLLNAPLSVFDELSLAGPDIYINIGLESADQETLDQLGKPLTRQMVIAAFELIQQLNDRYRNIEITANFVTGDTLSENHYQALLSLVRESIPRRKSKGCIYLSPLRFGSPSRSQLFTFYRLKVQSRLPLFLYTIQKL